MEDENVSSRMMEETQLSGLRERTTNYARRMIRAYRLELLAGDSTLPTARLTPLREETNELIAIFVTVLLNAKRRHAT